MFTRWGTYVLCAYAVVNLLWFWAPWQRHEEPIMTTFQAEVTAQDSPLITRTFLVDSLHGTDSICIAEGVCRPVTCAEAVAGHVLQTLRKGLECMQAGEIWTIGPRRDPATP